MEFSDRTLVCKDCSQDFTFSAKEQEFYDEKGFQNDPVRCKACRDDRKEKLKGGRGGGGGGRGGRPGGGYGGGGGGGGGRGGPPRKFYDVTCSECGVETQVPFKPTEGKPVMCRDCYRR